MSIQDELNQIKNAVYGKDVRDAIHDSIKKAYDDASENGNANMEVRLARGTNPNLNTRLNKMEDTDRQTTAQLAQTEREVFRKRELDDLSADVLSAIAGGEETSFNLLSEPRNESVSYLKTDRDIRNKLIKVEKYLGSNVNDLIDEKDISVYGGASTQKGYVNNNQATSSGLVTVYLRTILKDTNFIFSTLRKSEGSNFERISSEVVQGKLGEHAYETNLYISEGDYLSIEFENHTQGEAIAIRSTTPPGGTAWQINDSLADGTVTTIKTGNTDVGFYYRIGGIKGTVNSTHSETGISNLIKVSSFGNDGTAINNALNSASYGDVVVLESGETYITTETIWIPSGVSLVSLGARARIKVADAPERNLDSIWWRTKGSQQVVVCNEFIDTTEERSKIQASEVHLRNIIVEGNTDEVMPEGIIGVLLTSVRNASAINVHTENMNYFEDTALNPSKGFGLTTRYCKDVFLLNPSGERAQYQNLGIYGGSEDVLVINPMMGEAGRTSGQIHGYSKNTHIIGGYFRNEGTLDGNTGQALTMHGYHKTEPILNVVLDNVTLETKGEYGGIALGAFGHIEDCHFNVSASSSMRNGGEFSHIYNCTFSGSFSSENDVAVVVRPGADDEVGVNFKDIKVRSPLQGFAIWGNSKNVSINSFDIISDGHAIDIGTYENISISNGTAHSKNGSGIITTSHNSTGFLDISNVKMYSENGRALDLISKSTNGRNVNVKNSEFKTDGTQEAAKVSIDNALIQGNITNGDVLIDATEGVIVKDNVLNGGILYTGDKTNHTEMGNILNR